MKEAGRNLWDLRTPMRDGVELSTDLYLPPDGLSGAPYPLILIRTPGSNQHPQYVKSARHLSDHGFAVAIQDVRGRHDSEGRFYPFVNEGVDGYDSIEWFASQAWCTGKIGMMGASYSAWAQWAAARERPPHLAALASTATWGSSHQGMPYRSGCVALPMLAWLHAVGGRVWQEGGQVDWDRVLRHLPLRTMDEALGHDLPVWRDWLEHPLPGNHWQSMKLDEADFRAIDLPVLHITGWHDDAKPGVLHHYEGMLAHSPAASEQVILIGPWDHAGTQSPTRVLGGVDFGASAHEDLEEVHLRWFDQLLKESPQGRGELAPSRVFVTGADLWRKETGSAPAAPIAYYLDSEGFANSHAGDGQLTKEPAALEKHDSYVYDPADPVVLTVDFNFFPTHPSRPTELPLDRRFVERRSDVLVYTSEVLHEQMEVSGQPQLHLWAGSNCPDTDWFVQLSDLDPRGPSIVISTGMLRARFRDGLAQEAFMVAGEIYEFRIELDPLAHVFKAGHRIRLSVTSSWFPQFDRNLNTDDPLGRGGEPRVATNHVYHDRTHPSRVILPALTARSPFESAKPTHEDTLR